jgi:uncharacterized protein (TIGR02246 family)
MRFPVLAFVIATSFVFVGCAPSADITAEEEAVRATSAHWLQLSTERDAAGVASLFAQDGALVWEDRPPTFGPAAIEDFMRRQFAEAPMAEGGFGPDRVDVSASGDLAVEQGTSQIPNGEGRYITVYRKIEGDWKVAADMFLNTSPDGGAPTWARESLARWYETFNARDVEAIADLYAVDARVGDARGRAAIIQRFRAGWAEQDESCSGAFDDFVVVGSVATGLGRDMCVVTPTDGGPPTTRYAQFLAVYERQEDGSWLCIRDQGEPLGSD